MASYLLAWNPNRWHWENLAEFMDAFKRGEVSTDRWSCGRNKHIATGDHVWLIRLGEDPRGVFGHGIVTTPSYEDVHWNDPASLGKAGGEIDLNQADKNRKPGEHDETEESSKSE